MSNIKFQIFNKLRGVNKIFAVRMASSCECGTRKFLLATSAIFILVISILVPLSEAAYMSGDNYILQLGTFGTVGGKPTGGEYKLGITVGQTAPGLYTGTNYKVKAGFQYIYTITTTLFTFTISQNSIDFGTISPTNPVTRTNTLTVTNTSSKGYTVTASENNPLKTAGGQVIPDTTCDNGTCSQTSSSAWTSTLTYGFGYRCDNVSGADCETGFTDTTFYKQFADVSGTESAQPVMKSTIAGANKQSQITYKINISGTQAAGTYGNVITYIATPTF